MQQAAAAYDRALSVGKRCSKEIEELRIRMDKTKKSCNREHPPISKVPWVETR